MNAFFKALDKLNEENDMSDARMAQDFAESIHKMMVAFGQAEEADLQAMKELPVEFPDSETRKLRIDLLREEYIEYLDAEGEKDLVEVADALGDMMVIIMGTAIAYNIDLPAVLGEIQRSNMSKVDPETGKVIKREDGKVLKPEGYFKPNVKDVM